MAIGKIGKITIKQIENSNNPNVYIKTWKGGTSINYTKYQIKETDLRVKTATFTSPDYIDLTTGQYAILISSKYHENFSGLVLDVDYDPSTKLYNYQCQDWSRTYMRTKHFFNDNTTQLYVLLQNYITRGLLGELNKLTPKKKQKKHGFTKKQLNYYKTVLSGLRPINQYNQSLWKGNKYKGNPMEKKSKFIVQGKTYIEVIRDIVFAQNGYFDIWFNDRGILQIEPLSKTDWEKTGLHLAHSNIAKEKYKFSTTNAITQVYMKGSGLQVGKSMTSYSLLNSSVDLTLFFGWVGTSIEDPRKKETTTKKSSSTTNVNSDNPYGTKNKVVYMNIDLIDGYSSDQSKMDKMCDLLKKEGWECHTCGVGSESHYQRRGEVKGGIWLTLYGGACAGTLREAATSNWYRTPLVNNGSRTVVGFFPPSGDIRKGGKYGDYLPRAHDDGFSGSDPSITNPQDFLTKHGIPFMYADNPSEMVTKFLKGGDNPEACNKDWKFKGS